MGSCQSFRAIRLTCTYQLARMILIHCIKSKPVSKIYFHSQVFTKDFFRFSVRLMVGGSISIHTIAHLAMRHYRKRYQVTPQILHDLDTSKPLRQSRHNKSILSQNSVWQFLGFFFLVVTILLAFGSAKGNTTLEKSVVLYTFPAYLTIMLLPY